MYENASLKNPCRSMHDGYTKVNVIGNIKLYHFYRYFCSVNIILNLRVHKIRLKFEYKYFK